jgi:5'-nucleotidase
VSGSVEGVRILVTNDDGVRAPGIAVLATRLAAAGHDIVVGGPLDDRSGSGAGIGPVHVGEGLTLEEVVLEGLGVPCFGIDGPPALSVMAARLGAFGDPPDIVVSGINPGCNTGRSVLHSGTVGAALTAANFGISGMAVSVGVSDPMHFDTAAELAVTGLEWLLSAPRRTVLNLNVPGLPLDEVRGVRRAKLAPFGTVRTAIAEQRDGRIELELRATEEELDPGTDTALVNAGWAAATVLIGVRADDSLDAAPALDQRIGRPPEAAAG